MIRSGGHVRVSRSVWAERMALVAVVCCCCRPRRRTAKCSPAGDAVPNRRACRGTARRSACHSCGQRSPRRWYAPSSCQFRSISNVATGGAVGAVVVRIVHVADVDVLDALRPGDVVGRQQRFERRGRVVEHAEVGMEGGEVQRHLVADVLEQPVAHAADFVGRSFSRGMIRFVISNQTSVSCLSHAERVEHRLQVRVS